MLFPLVEQLVNEKAYKVTGMLLELDKTEVLNLVESPDTLRDKVAEAMKVLELEATATAAAAASGSGDGDAAAPSSSSAAWAVLVAGWIIIIRWTFEVVCFGLGNCLDDCSVYDFSSLRLQIIWSIGYGCVLFMFIFFLFHVMVHCVDG